MTLGELAEVPRYLSYVSRLALAKILGHRLSYADLAELAAVRSQRKLLKNFRHMENYFEGSKVEKEVKHREVKH